MLLCNYELPQALVPPLALPTPASTATVSPTSLPFTSAAPLSSASLSSSIIHVILVVLVNLVHPVPAVAAVTRRWAGRVAAAPVAALAECAKEADMPSVDHCLRLCALLLLLHLDDEDGVALAVPLSALVDVYVVNLVVALDDGCDTRTHLFEAHHLQNTPIKLVLGVYLLLLHLLHDVVVGTGARLEWEYESPMIDFKIFLVKHMLWMVRCHEVDFPSLATLTQ